MPPPSMGGARPRPTSLPVQPLASPALYEEMAPRFVWPGSLPQPLHANTPPFAQKVGEWLLVPELLPPCSDLHQRRAQRHGGAGNGFVPQPAPLDSVVEEEDTFVVPDNSVEVPLLQPLPDVQLLLCPVAAVSPQPNDTVDLLAHEALPANSSGEEGLPPPGSNSCPIPDPVPPVAADGDPCSTADVPGQLSPTIDGARALSPVSVKHVFQKLLMLWYKLPNVCQVIFKKVFMNV